MLQKCCFIFGKIFVCFLNKIGEINIKIANF